MTPKQLMLRTRSRGTTTDGPLWLLRHITGIATKRFDPPRMCLDHVIVFDEKSLRCTLRSYFSYHHRSRLRSCLDKDSPDSRPVLSVGKVIAIPEVGGPTPSLRTMRCLTLSGVDPLFEPSGVVGVLSSLFGEPSIAPSKLTDVQPRYSYFTCQPDDVLVLSFLTGKESKIARS